MKQTLAAIVTAVLCFSLFTGCSDAEVNSVSEQSTSENAAAQTELPDQLIIGLDDTFAPMGFRDEANNLVGFDIDLANAVGEELGIEIVFQPINWTAKEMELEARTVDCLWNGMSRTPEREKSMRLSQDYLNNKIIIMTNEGVTVDAIGDLANYQIGTQAGSSALEMMQAHEIYATIQANINEYATYDECILDMQAGRIDVMIVDEVLGQYKNNHLEQKFAVAPVDFGNDFYCIGFRKDDEALCQAVENALKTLSENGKGEEISQKWFGENLLLSFQ